MSVDNQNGGKRQYKAPTLIKYGDMVALTKNQSGTSKEATGNMGIKTKP